VDDPERGDENDHRTRPHHRFGLFVAVLAAPLLLVACGGGGSKGVGVASVGSVTTTTARTSSNASGGGELAMSRCMRSHGVPNFPDPGANGEITINAIGGKNSDLDPNSAAFKAAQKACASLLPNGGKITPADKERIRADALRMAQCMRSHGILDFPDPNPDGGISIEAKPGSDLAPDSPRFKAANDACQSIMPGRGGGTLHTEGGPGSASNGVSK
jgi:hypothetical protein